MRTGASTQLFDKESLALQVADAEKYLAAKPGNNYVKIVYGSVSEDSFPSPGGLRLHLAEEEPPATDPAR